MKIMQIEEFNKLNKEMNTLFFVVRGPLLGEETWDEKLHLIYSSPENLERVLERLHLSLELTRVVDILLADIAENNRSLDEIFEPNDDIKRVKSELEKCKYVEKLVNKVLDMYLLENPGDAIGLQAKETNNQNAVITVLSKCGVLKEDLETVETLLYPKTVVKQTMDNEGFFNLEDKTRFLAPRHKFPLGFLNNTKSRSKFLDSKNNFLLNLNKTFPKLTKPRSQKNYLDCLNELDTFYKQLNTEKAANKRSFIFRFRRRETEKNWDALINEKQKQLAEKHLLILEDIVKNPKEFFIANPNVYKDAVNLNLVHLGVFLSGNERLEQRYGLAKTKLLELSTQGNMNTNYMRAVACGTTRAFQISYLIRLLEANQLNVNDKFNVTNHFESWYHQAKNRLFKKTKMVLAYWRDLSDGEQDELKLLRLMVAEEDANVNRVDALALQRIFEETLCRSYRIMQKDPSWKTSGWKTFEATLENIRKLISCRYYEEKYIKRDEMDENNEDAKLLLSDALDKLKKYAENEDGESYVAYAEDVINNLEKELIRVMPLENKNQDSPIQITAKLEFTPSIKESNNGKKDTQPIRNIPSKNINEIPESESIVSQWFSFLGKKLTVGVNITHTNNKTTHDQYQSIKK